MSEDVVITLGTASSASIREPAFKQALLVSGMETWAAPNDPEIAPATVERKLARFRDIGEKIKTSITGDYF